jgi:Xaa-Pro dipeptidase
MITRRALLGTGVGVAAAGSVGAIAEAGGDIPLRPRPIGLRPITGEAKPITPEERAARLAKAQDLLRRRKLAALLVESGSTLEYFTGIRWWTSERVTAAVIPADGQVIVVTPFFESPSIHEMLQVPAEIRPWQEDQDPFQLLAGAVLERPGARPLAVGPNVRFFIIDAVARRLKARRVVPGSDIARACRMIKSPAELALMQIANEVTLAAIRHTYENIHVGMQSADVVKMLDEATAALGGVPDFSLALLNEASAYPHGSKVVQTVHENSVILVDAGCSVNGYRSDISRTWVFGEPTKRQREIWNTVKRGQEVALEAARIGAPCGAVDKAVRSLYEAGGWSRDYALPGLPHRTGHGIGMDGHEDPYLVRNDTTALEAGMCFSDEPGLYVPGEFGVRLEDCWHMTEHGPKLFTPLAESLAKPV